MNERPQFDAQLVSVVLPTRNRSSLLVASLRSVLEQTWTSLEVLVVNDGSTDRTRDVLDEMAAADPRVTPYHLERPRGAGAARNYALFRSRGDVIAFQDDDTLWASDKIERPTHALEDAGPDVGFVYSGVESEEVDGSRRYLGTEIPQEKYQGPWMAGTCSVLVRREPLLAAGGFDEELVRLQDFDLWVRVLTRTGYVCIPRVLVHTKRGPDGISARSDTLLEASRQLRRKYSHAEVLSPTERAHVHHALGHKLMMEGYWLHGVRCFLGAVRSNPMLFRSWLALGAAGLYTPGYRAAVAWRSGQLGQPGRTPAQGSAAR